MSVDKDELRRFRIALRQFERIIGNQIKCCCSKVSLPQCHVLLKIDTAEIMTTGELARELNLDISTISRTVDNLVKAEFVTRIENPEDRRSFILQTTLKGAKLAETINSDADAYIADVLNCISQRKRATVVECFNTLTEAFVVNDKLKRQLTPCYESITP
jgi:DNA-binding MarR family transcriptional regulator